MNHHEKIPVIDRALAQAASIATYIGTKVRPVGNLYMSTHLNTVRLHYRPVDEFDPSISTWAKYEGDETGVTLPVQKLYKQVARTLVDAPAFDTVYTPGDPDAQPAIGWKIGNATLAGLLTDEQYLDILNDGYYDTLLGGGPHVTALGAVAHSTGKLIVSYEAVTAGPVMDLADYPSNGVIY